LPYDAVRLKKLTWKRKKRNKKQRALDEVEKTHHEYLGPVCFLVNSVLNKVAIANLIKKISPFALKNSHFGNCHKKN